MRWRRLEADRIGNISAFVAVASQLILIKSRAMLPRRTDRGPRGARRTRARTPRRSCGRGCCSTARIATPGCDSPRTRSSGRAVPTGAVGGRMRPGWPAPGRPTRRRSIPAVLVRALAGSRRSRRRRSRRRRSCRGRSRSPSGPRSSGARSARRADGRPPGPARRRSRPGGRRGDVPRDARAHEAPRDRRRAGRAVGSDRRPRDDGRGARPPAASPDATRRSTNRWSRSHDRRRTGRGRSRVERRSADGARDAERRASRDERRRRVELTEAALEALLFVAERPLAGARSRRSPGSDRATVDARLGDLEVSLAERGIRLARRRRPRRARDRARGGALVGRYVGADAVRLSPASLETLAIVAYRQPVTRAAVERIRGVDSDYTVRTLLHRRLIVELGRSEAPGRPFLYGTGFESSSGSG